MHRDEHPDFLHEPSYSSGLMAGIEIGRRQVLDEQQEHHKVVRAIVARLSRTTSYADLCDRRGETARAEHARETLRENGVSAC